MDTAETSYSFYLYLTPLYVYVTNIWLVFYFYRQRESGWQCFLFPDKTIGAAVHLSL